MRRPAADPGPLLLRQHIETAHPQGAVLPEIGMSRTDDDSVAFSEQESRTWLSELRGQSRHRVPGRDHLSDLRGTEDRIIGRVPGRDEHLADRPDIRLGHVPDRQHAPNL